MIEIKFDAREVLTKIGGARRNLTKATREVLEQQGRSAKRYAKSIAPKKSGALKRGIGYSATDNTLKLISVAKGRKGFPYNKWVNQDPGFVSLGPYKKRNPKYHIKQGDILIYGNSPSHWRWTGTPRYMELTWWRLRKNFPLAYKRKLKTIW